MNTENILTERQKEIRKDNLVKGIIIINEAFDSEMMERVYFELKNALDNKNIDEVKLYINSNGGAVTANFPLISLIESAKKPVSTFALGHAYSSAATLLLCGTKGKRYCHRNTTILLHEVASDRGYAKTSQIKLNSRFIDEMNERLIKIILTKTKITKKQMDGFMRTQNDQIIWAEDALKFGIVDKII